jgi:hypothetical protein
MVRQGPAPRGSTVSDRHTYQNLSQNPFKLTHSLDILGVHDNFALLSAIFLSVRNAGAARFPGGRDGHRDLCDQKGGTGKITTVVSLAVRFAAASQRTLLIDTDPQQRALAGRSVVALPFFPSPWSAGYGPTRASGDGSCTDVHHGPRRRDHDVA